MQRRFSKQSWKVTAAVVLIAMAAAACGGDDSGGTIAGDESQEERGNLDDGGSATPEAPAGDADAGGEAAEGGGDSGLVVQPVQINRDIIYTAELTIAVSDVATAADEAIAAIEGAGGFVFGERTVGAPENRTVLTFKIDPESFQGALDELGALGEVRSQNVSAEDVTDRVVDLESRIATAEVSVERLREFLAQATDARTVAELERELLDRETTLETLKGQLRTLEDQVALATITVTLTEALADPSIRLTTTAYRGHDQGAACPGTEGISVDRDDDVTICFEIRNNGDTPLAGLTLVDTVLEVVEIDELTVVFGDPGAVLPPGQDVLLAYELTASRRVRTQTKVTANPVNEEGTRIESRDVAATASIAVDAEEPEGLPGFDDGFRVATDVLAWFGGMIVVSVGLLVPFVWVIALLWLGLWWRGRRVRSQVDAAVAEAEAHSRHEAATVERPAGNEPADEPTEIPTEIPDAEDEGPEAES
ncbi:MAG TPA: DUF4349 domain-containing protein [Acidimicrobiia bacterium]|jgi:hypothetical protein